MRKICTVLLLVALLAPPALARRSRRRKEKPYPKNPPVPRVRVRSTRRPSVPRVRVRSTRRPNVPRVRVRSTRRPNFPVVRIREHRLLPGPQEHRKKTIHRSERYFEEWARSRPEHHREAVEFARPPPDASSVRAEYFRTMQRIGGRGPPIRLGKNARKRLEEVVREQIQAEMNITRFSNAAQRNRAEALVKRRAARAIRDGSAIELLGL